MPPPVKAGTTSGLAGELRLHVRLRGPLRRRPVVLHHLEEAAAEQERRRIASLLVRKAVHLLVRFAEADAPGRVLDVLMKQ